VKRLALALALVLSASCSKSSSPPRDAGHFVVIEGGDAGATSNPGF
jgi:hypothetical protein